MVHKQIKYDDIIREEKVPVVAIDHNSMFTHVNKAFEDTYGWRAEDLIGQSVTSIIPPYLRDAHQIGFSRFLITEEVTLMGQSLPLEILYKDGTVRPAEHYIVGDKKHNEWRFAATIKVAG